MATLVAGVPRVEEVFLDFPGATRAYASALCTADRGLSMLAAHPYKALGTQGADLRHKRTRSDYRFDTLCHLSHSWLLSRLSQIPRSISGNLSVASLRCVCL